MIFYYVTIRRIVSILLLYGVVVRDWCWLTNLLVRSQPVFRGDQDEMLVGLGWPWQCCSCTATPPCMQHVDDYLTTTYVETRYKEQINCAPRLSLFLLLCPTHHSFAICHHFSEPSPCFPDGLYIPIHSWVVLVPWR